MCSGTSRTCCLLSSGIRRCCYISTIICLLGRTHVRLVCSSGDKDERRVGINENLAREILELHTLGVGGGYTQADVTTFAEVITGWSIGGDDWAAICAGRARRICFRPEIHEPGAKWCWETLS